MKELRERCSVSAIAGKFHDNGLGWSWFYCNQCGARIRSKGLTPNHLLCKTRRSHDLEMRTERVWSDPSQIEREILALTNLLPWRPHRYPRSGAR